MKTVAEIKEILLQVRNESDPLLEQYRTDTRSSVQKLVASCLKRLQLEASLRQKFQEMNQFEDEIHSKGFQLIAGIDEAGRGPLAGPVVAGAVILPKDFLLLGLNDSKQLSEKRRSEFFDFIVEHAIATSTGIVTAQEIDEINIYEATKLAMQRAISNLACSPGFLLIDAMKISTSIPSESIIKGDARSNSIAAASVIAKVTRDRMMLQYAQQYPNYSFEKHMGYGTREHFDAIHKFGPCPIHRMTFAPLNQFPSKV